MMTHIDVGRGRLFRHVYYDNITPECGDAIMDFINTYDGNKLQPTTPDGESSRANNTLYRWITSLSVMARHRDLTTASIDDVIRDLEAMKKGHHPETQTDEGLSVYAMRQYESTLRMFYRHHDCGITPTDIPIEDRPTTSIDEHDVLDGDEIQQARDATTNIRNLLVFDLLCYTGQRKNALRTLRVKDIDLDEGTYRYNTSEGGLKGAEKRQGNRPLLGALSSVRTWINKYHPNPQPDKYLITHVPSNVQKPPSEMVAHNLFNGVMDKIKENSGIDKPMNPHMMRHTFVTICKRDYGLDDDKIKWLIGHSKGSNVMSTTYSHLSDLDYRKDVEVAWGIRDEEEQSSLTPPVCYVCDEPMPSETAKACPNCGEVYTPDAKSVEEQLDDAMFETATEATTDTDKEQLAVLRQVVKDNKAELINMLAAESDSE